MIFCSSKLRIAAFTLLLASGISAQIRLVPVAEGWAKNQVNAVIFRKNSVTSFKDQQYVAFYNGSSQIVLAKRRHGSMKWQLRTTKFTANTADAHNSISIAVDGKGFLHLAWGNHNTQLNYARSVESGSLEMGDKTAMVGRTEEKATYPEFYSMPNGDLLFFYRDGASGNGDLVLNRYDLRSGRWSRIQDDLVDGERKRNAYPQIAVDTRGTIHMSWAWRESPDVATNHDLCYARSGDGGKTWTKSSGEKYQIPITASTAEYVWQIPQKSELINQTSMAVDADGNPYIATYWRSADSAIPQYRLVYFDGKKWMSSQVSNRTTPFSLSGGGTKRIPISRPQVVVDDLKGKRRVIVIFRDAERGSRVSAAISDDLNSGKWRIVDLSNSDVGMWEPSFDLELWQKKKHLNIFVQNVGQGDGEKLEDLAPQMISILEWTP
ncbi:MAG TPA: BNR repeat-containing protein [Pyrinomonadaceae bacterium]|nr:BNR repeat-containing protein [Pyrinomonadaceae bacterium]